MLKNYFKIAWRNITRHKGFTLINVLGLSLGICASLVIYLITSYELSYDRFHPDGDRIYRIVANQRGDDGKMGYIGGMSNPLPMALRRELTGFERVTEFHNYFARVTVPNGSHEPKIFDPAKRGEEASPIIIAEPQYFDIFNYQWLEGSPAAALSEPYKVVLSRSEVYKYFGPGQLGRVIGRQVVYKDVFANDSLQLTVAGVVEDWAGHSDFGFKDFISFATIEHSWLKEMIHMDNWGNWNPSAQGFVKLAKGVEAAQVEKQFPAAVAAHVPSYPGWHTSLVLQPLKDIHFNSDYRDTYSRHAHLPTLYALMGIALFILLIAAVNFVNLSTAQSLQRAKEIGVRKVLGGSKVSLRVQFLVETFLVTAAAAVLAVVLAGPALHFSRQFIPAGVALNLSDPATVGFLLLIVIMTALLAGFYPAKVLSAYSPVLNLRGSGTQGADKSGFFGGC
ncbi:ABC transporter permease [Puia sp. P3]|uniref:ABC transporter permease n=1 Tax=Puia sp. P3 TaxID=3423952 RepID=UPI003D66D9EC